MKKILPIFFLLYVHAFAQTQVGQGGTSRQSLDTLGILLGANKGPVISLSVGSAGQFLQSNGAGVKPSWVAGGSGSGTVTSVGLSLPNIFTVTNSPVTGSGTLTGTLASQTQNKVFASPNGSSGAPSFRALVSGDIPSLSYEPVITAGTTAQYWRGDKSWQTLNASAVGLGNVTNNLQLTAANNLSDLVSASTARTNLGLGTLATQSGTFSGTSSGTNTGDQTITLTGNVTGSGTGSFATTIANLAVTNAMIAASTIDLTAKVTGLLPVGNGGIGIGTLASNGVLYGNGTGAVQALAANSTVTNKFLTQSSSNAPAWNTLVSGDIPNNGANTTGSAAKWTTARNLAGNSVDGSANVAFSNAFIVQGTSDAGLSGAQFLGSLATGIVKNTTTTGVLSIAINSDLPVMSATVGGAVPTPPNDAAKFLNGTGAWTVPSGGSSGISGATNKGAMYATGSTTGTSTGALTDGQILIGSTAGNPAAATITGTSNQITVTNGSNTITLATPQDIATGSSPSFTGLTVGSSSGLVTSNAGVLTFNTAAANAIPYMTSTTAATANSANLTYSTSAGMLDKISDAGTTTVVDLLTIEHTSSGTPAANFGTGLLFEGKTSMTADRNMMEMQSIWTTATEASQVSKYILKLVNGSNTLAEVLNITGAGNATFAGTIGATNFSGTHSGTSSGTNTGDVTLAGENYITIASQVITAAAVNLSGTHATGTLAAARFGALTGDVTSAGGTYATVVGKVNGVSYGTSPATNTVPVVTGSNTVTYEAVPNAALAFSAITIQGSSVSLGGSALSTTSTPQFATIGLGVAADATIPFLSAQTSATTNALVTQFQNSLSSSGTPAANFGQKYLYRLDDNTTANQNAGAQIFEWATATHATHASQYRLQLSTAGAALADVLTVTGAGNGTFAGTVGATNFSGTHSGTSSGTNTGDVTLAGENYLSIASQVITANAVSLSGTNVTNTLPYNKGGTAQSSWTKGDLLYSDNTNSLAKLGIGTTNYVLTVISGLPSWQPASGGMTNPMTTTGDMIYSSDNSGTPARKAIGTSGQVLSVAAGIPSWATGLVFTSNVNTGTSATAATNNDYAFNNAALFTLTLPTTAAVGDVVGVLGNFGGGGWKIAQSSGQYVYYRNVVSTTGATGYVQAHSVTNNGGAVALKCVVANNGWVIFHTDGCDLDIN